MKQEQIKAKAKEYFPNDEFKQQAIIDTINWATKELQKENAELKEALKGKVCNCMTYLNFKDLEKECAKAKEIIREFVEWANWQGNKCPSFKSIQDKAGQFLKESEE